MVKWWKAEYTNGTVFEAEDLGWPKEHALQLTYVFERLLKFRERCQAGFDDAVGPLADLGVRVAVAADGWLDGLLDDVGNFVHDKLGLEMNLG